MQIKVKLVYQIFVTKPRRIQWRTEEAYLKSEAVAALPKLRRGLGGADYEDCFLKDAGHDRVYCFRLAPKVSLPSGSENDRDGLGCRYRAHSVKKYYLTSPKNPIYTFRSRIYLHCIYLTFIIQLCN